MTRTSLKLAAAAAAFVPALAGAQLEFKEPMAGTGTGLGAVLTVLTLNNTDDVSSGCVTPTGTSGCGFVDNTVQQSSQTRLVSELGGNTATLGTDLRIVANFAEPQNDVDGATVQNLQLQLFDMSGTSVFTSMLTGGAVSFSDTNAGVGNIGFGFGFTEAGALAFQTVLNGFASLEGVRIGLGASLTEVQGGLDTFQITRLNSAITPPAVVPEPSTWALLGTGLLSIGGMAARRRRA
jgi:hypothetical protein